MKKTGPAGPGAYRAAAACSGVSSTTGVSDVATIAHLLVRDRDLLEEMGGVWGTCQSCDME